MEPDPGQPSQVHWYLSTFVFRYLVSFIQISFHSPWEQIKSFVVHKSYRSRIECIWCTYGIILLQLIHIPFSISLFSAYCLYQSSRIYVAWDLLADAGFYFCGILSYQNGSMMINCLCTKPGFLFFIHDYEEHHSIQEGQTQKECISWILLFGKKLILKLMRYQIWIWMFLIH